MIEVKITYEQVTALFGSIYGFTAKMITRYKNISVNTQKVGRCFILSAISEDMDKFLVAENIIVEIEDNADDSKYKVLI